MLKKFLLLLLFIFSINISFAENTANGVITKEQRCQIAENNLRVLSDISKPIYRRDINGNRVEMTYAEILKERQESENLIKIVCLSDNQKYQQETRSFGSNLINKAKSVSQKDTITAAIEQALLLGDYDEVYTIMVYVLDIHEKDVKAFIKIAKRKNPTEALSIYIKQYKNKARNKNPRYNPNKKHTRDDKKQDNSRAHIPVAHKQKVTTDSGEELYYQSNPKHTVANKDKNYKYGIEPNNVLDLFEKSVALQKDKKGNRYTVDKNGVVHRFANENNGTYHWNGSTADKNNPLDFNEPNLAPLREELKKMRAKI